VNRERLNILFVYIDGALYRKLRLISGFRVGAIAGCPNEHGYWSIRVDGKIYLRHRLIFLMHHGYLPEVIDHINRVPGDDHIDNLREVTPSQNQINSDRYDGAKGFSYDKERNRFRARIEVNRKTVHLGYFVTAEEARAAYLSARGEKP
jgi:hypothetical protein